MICFVLKALLCNIQSNIFLFILPIFAPFLWLRRHSVTQQSASHKIIVTAKTSERQSVHGHRHIGVRKESQSSQTTVNTQNTIHSWSLWTPQRLVLFQLDTVLEEAVRLQRHGRSSAVHHHSGATVEQAFSGYVGW